ncbi:hypothetical protein ACHAWF_011378, partial [Thalassiosira exigua]
IKDLNGKRINQSCSKNDFSGNDKNPWGWKDYTKRSSIVGTSSHVIFDDILVVELAMKSLEKNEPPLSAICPRESLLQKDPSLDKHADVSFTFPNDISSDEGKPAQLFAHRAILQICAPGLAELCESSDKSNPVPIANVHAYIFELLLIYVYGKTIPTLYWIAFSKDLLDAADRYGVTNLKLEAEAWYVRQTAITSDNAMEILLYAVAKNCALLKESVMDYFAKNGKEALENLSFDEIPDPGSLFTGLLLATSLNSDGNGESNDGSSDNPTKYKTMRINGLKRELDELGADTDGSRETLIKRLESLTTKDNK